MNSKVNLDHSIKDIISRANSACLSDFTSLLKDWLPGGRIQGKEFIAGGIDGEAGRSLSVNIKRGVWEDFATGDKGGDPVSLYASIKNIKMLEAARELARRLGIEETPVPATPARKPPSPRPAAKPATGRAIMPIPKGTPSPNFRHHRLGNPSTVWDYRDLSGEIIGCVARFDKPDGKEILPLTYREQPRGKAPRWEWKGFDEPKPLYGLDRLAKSGPETRVILVEGEKAADAGQHMAGSAFVVLAWFGGVGQLGKADFPPLRGRRVILWPDHDEPGRNAMTTAAGMLVDAGAVVEGIVEPDPTWPAKADLADFPTWTAEDLGRVIRERLRPWGEKCEQIPPAHADEAEPPKSGYKLTDGGLFFIRYNNDGNPLPPEFVCSPIQVKGQTRGEKQDNWGLLLEWKDPDGHSHQWAAPMREMTGEGTEFIKTLVDLGLKVAPGTKAKNRLLGYLGSAETERRYYCTEKIGWYGESAFVLPDKVVPEEAGGLVVYQTEGIGEHPFSRKGSLREWRESVASACLGNSRLVLAVSMALAAPLLKISDDENGGFHIVGPSSCGKTTSALVAGSVWGGKEMKMNWNTTANNLGGAATSLNDCLMILDELSQCEPKAAGEAAYLLANGIEKGRLDKNGSPKSRRRWRLLFLSTGEIDLSQHLLADGRAVKAGQDVRLLSIPADAGSDMGLFEDLRGFDSGEKLADAVKAMCLESHGTAGPAFVEFVIRDRHEIRDIISNYRRKFLEQYVPGDAESQVRRAALRFALVGIAGELGTQYGITGWEKGDAMRAAATCFKAWREYRGGVENLEKQQFIQGIKDHFQRFGASKYAPAKEPGIAIPERLGFYEEPSLGSDDGAQNFLVMPEVFKKHLCFGLPYKDAVTLLVEKGAILPGTEPDRYTDKIRIQGHGRKSYYRISADKLFDLE